MRSVNHFVEYITCYYSADGIRVMFEEITTSELSWTQITTVSE